MVILVNGTLSIFPLYEVTKESERERERDRYVSDCIYIYGELMKTRLIVLTFWHSLPCTAPLCTAI